MNELSLHLSTSKRIKGKINELTKYVNAMKEQNDSVKQTEDKLQELGKQIKFVFIILNKAILQLKAEI